MSTKLSTVRVFRAFTLVVILWSLVIAVVSFAGASYLLGAYYLVFSVINAYTFRTFTRVLDNRIRRRVIQDDRSDRIMNRCDRPSPTRGWHCIFERGHGGTSCGLEPRWWCQTYAARLYRGGR